jgi:hypothetical protein
MDCLNPFLSICEAIILVSLCTSIACSIVDIEYNHDVVGTGTVMTDYRMGDKQSSEASGAIRGTGDVINSYSLSTNNSTDLRVEDKFVLTRTTEKAITMSLATGFPSWTGDLGGYRLIGESWAEKIELASQASSSTYSSSNAKSL